MSEVQPPPYIYDDVRITYDELCFLYDGGYDEVCVTQNFQQVRKKVGAGGGFGQGRKRYTPPQINQDSFLELKVQSCIVAVSSSLDQTEVIKSIPCEVNKFKRKLHGAAVDVYMSNHIRVRHKVSSNIEEVKAASPKVSVKSKVKAEPEYLNKETKNNIQVELDILDLLDE